MVDNGCRDLAGLSLLTDFDQSRASQRFHLQMALEDTSIRASDARASLPDLRHGDHVDPGRDSSREPNRLD